MQGRDNQAWNSKATHRGRALSYDSLIPGPAHPPSTMAWEELWAQGTWPPRARPTPLSHCGSCLRLPRALSPPHIGCWGEMTREGRCQPVGSKVAKPVEASGAGTLQKEAWPRPAGTCQDASLAAPHGGGGFATPASSLQRAPQGPQPQPGPNGTQKSSRPQSVTTVTMSSKPG